MNLKNNLLLYVNYKSYRIIIFALLFTITNNIFAQPDVFFKDISSAIKEKPKITFRFDSRNSFISNERAQISSVKIGLDYQKKIRLGLSFSFLRTVFKINREVFENDIKQTVSTKLHLEYLSVFADYVFYKNKKWEFNLPIQLGGGYNYLKYSLNNEKHIIDKSFIIIYEANINGMYKLIKGIGVGAGTGYRIMLLGNPKIKKHFTSPIYVFRVKIFPFDFFPSIKK